MDEQKFNTIIGNSLDWRFKIPDAGGMAKPFDGIGLFKGLPVYWEAKNLKKVEAFNFNRLEDHQIFNLLTIQQQLKQVHAWFIVCVDFGRADKRVFLFRDMDYINNRKKNKKRILKKEWLERKNYVKIKKELIDLEELLSLPDDWEY